MTVQLGLPLADDPAPAAAPSTPEDPGPPAAVPPEAPVSPPGMIFVRRRGTRRYILRVLDDGTLRVTVPWRGNTREARRFADAQHAWVARQRAQRLGRAAARWTIGATVLIDGVPCPLVEDEAGRVLLAGQVVAVASRDARTLRTAVQAWLRGRAAAALPGELLALAARHDIAVTRVAIRNQASRWGSCSRRGAISLNWRLVQVPPFVREYVLLHELMHRRELNHSTRFWRHVAAACPGYVAARRWLRVDGAQLFD